MRDTYRPDRDEVKAPITAPAACPSCRSADIKTTSKSVNVETYWRCVACGEVWNVTRRETRRPSYGSFSR